MLGEIVERGFGGVMIGTLPKGTSGNLDDPALDPFWQAASDLGAAVFLHPMFLCGEPRLADYDLVNAIGRLADTSIAVSRLLFSGHLLKFPGMKFVLSHGGAALPYALGRLARNHAISPGKYADPRKGFEAMYFDSCVFDADSLEYLAKKAAPGRIMLGSDQPFPIGDPEPKKVVEGAYLQRSSEKRHPRRDRSARVPRAAGLLAKELITRQRSACASSSREAIDRVLSVKSFTHPHDSCVESRTVRSATLELFPYKYRGLSQRPHSAH